MYVCMCAKCMYMSMCVSEFTHSLSSVPEYIGGREGAYEYTCH